MVSIGDKINRIAQRVAETASDVPIARAVLFHAGELRELMASGVTLGRLSEALAMAGVLGPRTGRPLSTVLLSRMIGKAREVEHGLGR